MADVIVDRPSREIVSTDSGAGWAVALIIIVALAVGALVWARYYRAPAAPASPGASVNVSLPSGGSTGGTNTGGSGSTGGTNSGTGY